MRTVRSRALHAALALTCLSAVGACNIADQTTGTKTSSTLTPARNLAGTWKTSYPVTFNYQTDFCAAKETVAAADWQVTWVITAVPGNDNAVDIQMNYTSSNYRKVTSSCGTGGTGYVPLVSPQFLRATVSSSAITVNDTRTGTTFSGSFTTDLMEGTWAHWECLIYCFGETTGTNQLKMMRQK